MLKMLLNYLLIKKKNTHTQNFLQESKLDSMFIRSVMHMSMCLPLAVTGATIASVFRC